MNKLREVLGLGKKSLADVLGVKETYSRAENPEMFSSYPEKPKAQIVRNNLQQTIQSFDSTKQTIKSGVNKLRDVLGLGKKNLSDILGVEPVSDTIHQQPEENLAQPSTIGNSGVQIDINENIEQYIPKIKVIINEPNADLGNTLAQRNNNPGNLIFAGQPNAVKGDGGFAKFTTPEIGFRALIKQVQADQKRNLTLRDFITKYAPPNENDTEKYIREVSYELGISETSSIAEIDPIELAKKMAKFESQTIVLD